MNSPKRIAFFTGSRADYGLLKPLMQAVEKTEGFQLQIVVGGSHFHEVHGQSVTQIDADGFRIDESIQVIQEDGGAIAIAKVMGEHLVCVAKSIERLKPDLIVLLGDRYEVLSAAAAATICRVPVAHVAGGDVTIGSYDNALRGAITSMSQIHFTTNFLATKNLLACGLPMAKVIEIGSPGIDNICETPAWTKQELLSVLGIPFPRKLAIVTFHPATLEPGKARSQTQKLIRALSSLDEDFEIVLTSPNTDNEFNEVVDEIEAFASRCLRARIFKSLGTETYINALRHGDLLIGNSSSAVYEGPWFGIPTVNIGERQTGRLMAPNVVSCGNETDEIVSAIRTANQFEKNVRHQTHGDGKARDKFMKALLSFDDFRSLIKPQVINHDD